MSLLKPKLTLDALEPVKSVAKRLNMKPDSVRKGCGIAARLQLIKLTDNPRAPVYCVRAEVDRVILDCLKKLNK